MDITVADLDRKSFTLDNAEDVRIYFDPDSVGSDPPLEDVLDLDFRPLSVTSILNFRESPDKDEAIDGWKNFYDGTSARRSPHWSDQRTYKQWRGTLAHYAVFSQVADVERSEEEDEAEKGLKYWFRHAPQNDVSDVPESILDAMETYWDEYRGGEDHGDARRIAEHNHDVNLGGWIETFDNEYNGVPAWERAMREVNHVCNIFQKEVIDAKGLTAENVLDAERYVATDTPIDYAGQADLLYEYRGDTYLADLKTSGKIRTDYKLQGAAYAHAIEEYDVDYVEVISIDPEDKECVIETQEDWGRSITSLANEFIGIATKTEQSHLREYVN